LQGYDSVAVRSDVELGGTDQTFNLLVGRDLQEAFGQPPQDILTMPLLEGLDGIQKMSKSLDNYIGIDEPAEIMYRKAMAVPDALILRYLALATDASQEEVAKEKAALQAGENPRDVKRRLAERLLRQFHPGATPDQYRRDDGAFARAEPVEVTLEAGERPIAQLFLDAGLVTSKGEARRLAAQRGLTLNEKPVQSVDEKVTPAQGWLLRRGTHRIIRLKVR
jgi:tyrosyl-tRNA synthetase